jgi:hypothetical protein
MVLPTKQEYGGPSSPGAPGYVFLAHFALSPQCLILLTSNIPHFRIGMFDICLCLFPKELNSATFFEEHWR